MSDEETLFATEQQDDGQEGADAVQQVAPDTTPPDYSKPDAFNLQIQGGILENLGIKMYTKVGKVLVEFAANAYDSDSPFVDIRFNAGAIAAAREIVSAKARERLLKEQAEAPLTGPTRKPRRKAHVIDDPLPDDIAIVIRDGGHGMTAMDMANRFLPLNRNRRKSGAEAEEDNFYSEAGKRLVMGRKGIGKLSAFGVAQRMTIKSKRAGQPFWTVLELDADKLKGAVNVEKIEIPHHYEDASADLDGHGTEITLIGLRCDAANFDDAEIQDVINETYYPIQAKEFDIQLNGVSVPKIHPELTYWYPNDMGQDEFREDKVSGEDWGELSFRYRVQFRKKRLDASKRGAYVYSKNRLAMSPSMLSLTTGMHNFMAHQYMECIVESDDLDNLNIDVIGTNRSDIIQNSDLVRSFLARLEEIMTEAIKANGAFREDQADEVIDKSPDTQELRRVLQMVHGSQRTNARALAKTFLKNYSADSEEFKHLTPLIVGAANAGEILIDLIKVSNSAETVAQIAPALIELREIERTDSVKLFQGRRRGIAGLQRVVSEGYENFGKGPHDEAQLHRLLKAQPWLIRSDLNGYLSSDEAMSTVLDRISREMSIGKYAKPEIVDPMIRDDDDEDTVEKKKTVRPDLVGLVANAVHPDHVYIIELKAPSTPLRIEHLQQLKDYMGAVEEFLKMEYRGQKDRIRVEGALIGAMPKHDTKSGPSKSLVREIDKQQKLDGYWEVIGLNEMLRRTERVHSEMITALANDESAGLVQPEPVVDVDITVEDVSAKTD